MFFGFSKNIGNGFRIGVGTKIGGRKQKSASSQPQSRDFELFLTQVNKDLEIALITFLEANGQDYNKLLKSNVDLDVLFLDNDNYKEFIDIFNKTKKDIEKVLYSRDLGVVAKRSITDSVFELKDYISAKYPDYTPSVAHKKQSIIFKIFKYFLILIGILFLIGFFASDESLTAPEPQTSQMK